MPLEPVNSHQTSEKIEELEQQVNTYKSLLEAHDQQVQNLTA